MQLAGFGAHRPVLRSCEDAHWADPSSLDSWSLAIERVRHLPVLLIVTFRPEFQPPWAGLPARHAAPLGASAEPQVSGTDRADRGGKALPAEVVDVIVERSRGVPLFVEELTKAVVEAGLPRRGWRLGALTAARCRRCGPGHAAGLASWRASTGSARPRRSRRSARRSAGSSPTSCWPPSRGAG